MTDTTLPEYLKPAFNRLDKAKAVHTENARNLDEVTTAITRTAEQKAGLEQENGIDTGEWRSAFRAAGAVLTDELRNRHLMRVASRELAQECDAMAEVLNFERDKLEAACSVSARDYRQEHYDLLRKYASGELDKALREACGPLIRAMKLKMLSRSGEPEREAEAALGYVEPEKEIMQEVVSWLMDAATKHHIRLSDEPVLYRAGLSAETLPHMDYKTASTPARRTRFYNELREREADLKARGLLP
ncbi:glycoprotein 3 [Enterobacter hormaechei subsp. steigerwaltii]|uniref:glycoprotein 3 n=1 Tax=Enterobacter hormaechei TaxID=158836 RepID=UPI001C6409FF|nr:glycoprotein 3 [Enterobacter hormaechei]HDC4320765.1 glycoprotein 3 [Enterobacter cloacae]ELC6552197.1 glycoprotein 3 [Enterobacter hormaechei]ELC6555067.1 glycoprotein 3 [Enterobacter hormaechei]ELS4570037.1 glycoprotein 3 [Enterobacter hormaechei]MBW7740465.1 glycoprotein 3 [Enterobacter hormaechei]